MPKRDILFFNCLLFLRLSKKGYFVFSFFHFFLGREFPDSEIEPTRLFSLNKGVDELNSKKLEELPGHGIKKKPRKEKKKQKKPKKKKQTNKTFRIFVYFFFIPRSLFLFSGYSFIVPSFSFLLFLCFVGKSRRGKKTRQVIFPYFSFFSSFLFIFSKATFLKQKTLEIQVFLIY